MADGHRYREPSASGDLDHDGVDDAAVLPVANAGSGCGFVYTAAVLSQAGQPKKVAATLLGDRAQVEELTIKVGQRRSKQL